MPSHMPLPVSFQKSYNNRNHYPRNLIRRTVGTYPSALAAYESRLDSADHDLFEKEGGILEVPIRDLNTDNGTGQGMTISVVHLAAADLVSRPGKAQYSHAGRTYELVRN